MYKGQLGVPLTVYPRYLLCSTLGFLGITYPSLYRAYTEMDFRIPDFQRGQKLGSLKPGFLGIPRQNFEGFFFVKQFQILVSFPTPAINSSQESVFFFCRKNVPPPPPPPPPPPHFFGFRDHEFFLEKISHSPKFAIPKLMS